MWEGFTGVADSGAMKSRAGPALRDPPLQKLWTAP